MEVKRMQKSKNLSHVYSDDDGYIKLGNAIIMQAVKDYRAVLQKLKKHPNSNVLKGSKQELEYFFHSSLYATITSIDPDMLIRKLNKEV